MKIIPQPVYEALVEGNLGGRKMSLLSLNGTGQETPGSVTSRTPKDWVLFLESAALYRNRYGDEVNYRQRKSQIVHLYTLIAM